MPKRYRKLRGDTAYYPFAARTGARAQRAMCGCCALRAWRRWPWPAVLLVRQTVFRGGSRHAPAAVPTAPGSHGPCPPPPM